MYNYIVNIELTNTYQVDVSSDRPLTDAEIADMARVEARRAYGYSDESRIIEWRKADSMEVEE